MTFALLVIASLALFACIQIPAFICGAALFAAGQWMERRRK